MSFNNGHKDQIEMENKMGSPNTTVPVPVPDTQYSSFRVTNPIDGQERRAVIAYRTFKRFDGKYYEVAYAICNPADSFNRKHGQKIALNRLNAQKNYVTIHSSEPTYSKQVTIYGHSPENKASLYIAGDEESKPSLTQALREVIVHHGNEVMRSWGRE